MKRKLIKKTKILLLIIVLILLGIFAIEFYMKESNKIASNTELAKIENQNKQENVGLNVGNKAPNFILEDLDGKKVSLWEFAGKKSLILNFWATWCPPCKQEMPLLQKYYEKNKDNIEIIAVNMQEDPKIIKNWANSFNITYPILPDSGSVKEVYQVIAKPTTYIIGKNGIIHKKKLGQLTEDELEANINEILS